MNELKLPAKTIKEAVNRHGTFFKREIRKKLESIPGVELITEEYPISYLNGTSIDLVIKIVTKNYDVILPIESKRVYKKEWIFFPDPNNSTYMYFLFEGKKSHKYPSVNLNNLNSLVCLEGLQIEKIEEDKYIANPDPIWLAAMQVCTGFRGLILEEIRERKKAEIINEKKLLLFPLIITNAEIYTCTNEKIELETGNLVDDINLNDEDWIILSHPFSPPEINGSDKLSISGRNYVSIEDRGNNSKEGMVVLNVNHINQFVEFIKTFE